MTCHVSYLRLSEAADRLGVSPKALRLWEERGLLKPLRTAAGWRAYGPDAMARAGEVITLRELGLSLAQTKHVLCGSADDLRHVLAAQQKALEDQAQRIAAAAEKLHVMRRNLATAAMPTVAAVGPTNPDSAEAVIGFDLPWPWGGERFELAAIHPITFIIGPLGSGKTRLARAIADAVPGAVFVDLDRQEQEEAGNPADHPVTGAKASGILLRLHDAGARSSPALTALVTAFASTEAPMLVIDMIEQGLDPATQRAVICYFRHWREDRRPLFLLTRSSAILDLDEVEPDEAIILCPANHSLPTLVAPYRGSPGYEAVATCLASPEVRARTEGVIAWRPPKAAPAAKSDPMPA